MLNPNEDFPTRTLLAYLGLILFLPVFMDCILAFRLYIVYPPKTTSKAQLTIIFVPILIFKIVRTVNLIVFMARFGKALLRPESTIIYFQTLWGTAPWTNLKIEWILQVFDNWYVYSKSALCIQLSDHIIHSYASGLFLWKLWLVQKISKKSGIVNSHGKFTSRCV